MKPVHFTICVKEKTAPIGQVYPEEKTGCLLERAINAIEEIRKVHPNAEISVEVEV